MWNDETCGQLRDKGYCTNPLYRINTAVRCPSTCNKCRKSKSCWLARRHVLGEEGGREEEEEEEKGGREGTEGGREGDGGL